MEGVMYLGGYRAALRLLAWGTAACLVFVGCGSSKQASDAPTTTTTAASVSTTTVDPASQAILNDYRAFWDAYLAAANPMNPDDPRLAEHATGEELGKLQSSFSARKGAGQTIRGTSEFAPVVKSQSGNTATVSDCYFDHTQIYDASGNPQGTVDAERQLVEVTMQHEGGVWKVSSISHKGSGCTASS